MMFNPESVPDNTTWKSIRPETAVGAPSSLGGQYNPSGPSTMMPRTTGPLLTANAPHMMMATGPRGSSYSQAATPRGYPSGGGIDGSPLLLSPLRPGLEYITVRTAQGTYKQPVSASSPMNAANSLQAQQTPSPGAAPSASPRPAPVQHYPSTSIPIIPSHEHQHGYGGTMNPSAQQQHAWVRGQTNPNSYLSASSSSVPDTPRREMGLSMKLVDTGLSRRSAPLSARFATSTHPGTSTVLTSRQNTAPTMFSLFSAPSPNPTTSTLSDNHQGFVGSPAPMSAILNQATLDRYRTMALNACTVTPYDEGGEARREAATTTTTTQHMISEDNQQQHQRYEHQETMDPQGQIGNTPRFHNGGQFPIPPLNLAAVTQQQQSPLLDPQNLKQTFSTELRKSAATSRDWNTARDAAAKSPLGPMFFDGIPIRLTSPAVAEEDVSQILSPRTPRTQGYMLEQQRTSTTSASSRAHARAIATNGAGGARELQPCSSLQRFKAYPDVGGYVTQGWVQCFVDPRSSHIKVREGLIPFGRAPVWGFVFLKLSAWSIQMWHSAQEAREAQTNKNMRPQGWIDLRGCRSVDGYVVDNEDDRRVFSDCVMCSFKHGRFEFRCEDKKQVDRWLTLIRRVQFECNKVYTKSTLEVTEKRLANIGPLLQRLVHCRTYVSKRDRRPSREDRIMDLLGEFFNLYDEEGKGSIVLVHITAMLQDLLEVRKRMLTTFMIAQTRRQQTSSLFTPVEIRSFETLQSKANALFNKYRNEKSTKALADLAVEIRMFMDREKDGTVSREEFASMAKDTMFKDEDMRQELEIRQLGYFTRMDDMCAVQ